MHKALQSKSCDTCSAVFAHAHETTDPKWKQRSICSLRASKRVVKVWPSLSSAQTENIHFVPFVQLCQSFAAFAHQFPVRIPLPCLSNVKYLTLDSEKVEKEQYFEF